MDHRHRVYYLANLNQNYRLDGWWRSGWDNHGLRYKANKIVLAAAVSSLKMRPVAEVHKSSDHWYAMMISCQKHEERKLVSTLNQLKDVDYVKLEGGYDYYQ